MRPVYIICLILWFVASYFLCNKYFTCTSQEPSATEAAVGSVGASTSDEGCITDIEFEDQDFLVSSTENFRFAISEETVIEPSEDFKNIISKVEDYLSDNPDRFMRLTGYYIDGEENASDHDNLGIARAKSVREYLRENGFNSTQLTTHGEMLTSECVDEGIILRGIRAQFGNITQ